MAILPDKHVHIVHDDVIRCRASLPNLNSANIFLRLVWGQTAKFKDFWYHIKKLYGMLVAMVSSPIHRKATHTAQTKTKADKPVVGILAIL